jgi:hypothetical protein
MKSIARTSALLALASVLAPSPAATQTPVGTTFTYQGRLSDGANPASGSFDFQFALFDAAVGGGQVGATLDVPGLNVTTGLFTASLDFGALAFGASARWLEVRVRPAGGGAYATLAARQRITAGPNALFASNADLLDGLTSAQFLRSDQGGTLAGTLAIHTGAAADLALSEAGIDRAAAGPTTLTIQNSDAAAGSTVQLQVEGGSTPGAPAYSFAGDPDTGLFRPAADSLALAVAGSPVVTVGTSGLAAVVSAPGAVALRGTGPGTVIGDGVFGSTGSGGRGVVAQNTGGGVALLVSSFSGDHVMATTAVGPLSEPLLRINNLGSILTEGTLAVGNAVAGATVAPAFSAFGNSANKDEAGISAANDVYVEGGLEVDGTVFVDGSIRLGGQSATDNDSIFFDTGTDQSLTWNDSQFQFRLSSGLALDGSVTLHNLTVLGDNPGFGADIRSGPGEFLTISADDDLAFVADDDDDNFGDFEWYRVVNDFVGDDHQLAALRAHGPVADHGDLLIRGQLSTGVTNFDVAERFRESEDVQPGDLVRADPARPGAVLRTAGDGDAAVLGVVSADPALLIGGTTFGASTLRAWGEDLEAEFAAEKSALEAEVLAEQPLSPPAKTGQRALERFAARRLAAVALAGRVPVNVDASFGEIQVGDLLAPSPVPGVAMKATRTGPVVGTALESLAGGRGRVLMFVHRGHYTPAAAGTDAVPSVASGNVTTDEHGYAQVDLPPGLGDAHADFRYQLTVLGGGTTWSHARVSRKIEDSRFTIQTSHPAVEVSWQVTGIRKD